MAWLIFITSALIVILAGIRLTRYADVFCDKLNLGRALIGVILLGLITSLPEAVTSIIAVLSFDAADLAIGNLLGSNTFNPLLIVVMDMMYRDGSVTNAVHRSGSYQIAGLFSIFLTGVVIAEIWMAQSFSVTVWGPVSLGTLLIAAIYIFGLRYMQVKGVNVDPGVVLPENQAKMSLTEVCCKLLFSAVVVVVAAFWLTRSANALAAATGLGQNFFGTIFLAFVTSLPEMVVTLSALKLGSLDLAVGNIMGSNMANVFLVALVGLFSSDPILASVSPDHIITGIIGILMVGIALMGIRLNNKKTFLHLAWDSRLLVLIFFLGHFFMYFK